MFPKNKTLKVTIVVDVNTNCAEIAAAVKIKQEHILFRVGFEPGSPEQ